MSGRRQGASLSPDGPPRAVLIAAIAVALAAIAVVLVLAASYRRPAGHQPVVIPAVPAPQANGPECQRLSAALPQRLGDYQRAGPAQGFPQGAAAWQTDDGTNVVLRCGLDKPPDFVVGSPIQVVNAVQWFQVTDGAISTWFTVDRPVYVALTLPQRSGPTPIQQISDVIAKTIPAVAIQPGPP